MGVVVVEGLAITVLVLVGFREAVINAIPRPQARHRDRHRPLHHDHRAGRRRHRRQGPGNDRRPSPRSSTRGRSRSSSSASSGPTRWSPGGSAARCCSGSSAPRSSRRSSTRPRTRRCSQRLGHVAGQDLRHAGLRPRRELLARLRLGARFLERGGRRGIGAAVGLLRHGGHRPGLGAAPELVDARRPAARDAPRADLDSLAAAGGGAASASSNTTFIESSAGIGEGARTGLASVVTGLLFACCLFISPLAGIIPSAATAPVLVIVGAMMFELVRHLEWRDPVIALPVLLTIVLMPMTYSITNGVGAGFVSYSVLALLGGRRVHPLMLFISAVFVWYFPRRRTRNADAPSGRGGRGPSSRRCSRSGRSGASRRRRGCRRRVM